MPRVVLIVDDDEMVRKVCRAFLRREFDVLEADGGTVALQLCQSVKVDVLLTDVVMPGMSGVELGRRVGLLQMGIQIVYMSGFLPEGDLPFGSQCLQKPFTPVDLITTIKKVVVMLDGG